MGGTHQDPGVTFRAPETVRVAVKQAVEAEGWTLQDLLLACLVAADRDLPRLLALVAPHRQPRRPSGRPRKRATD